MNRLDTIDTDIDRRIAGEVANVDWHTVSEAEGASFGLALGLYRDVLHSYEKRRVAWGTATGGVISLTAMCLLGLAVHAPPLFILTLIIVTQTARALWLFYKTRQSAGDVGLLEQQAVDSARLLADAHPVQLGP